MLDFTLGEVTPDISLQLKAKEMYKLESSILLRRRPFESW